MMGIVVPETCWASNKICNENRLLHLVGILFPKISLLFSAWQTGVMCVEGTDFSVLHKINFMPWALGLRLAELGEFTTIPKTGPYSDMLKTGNHILCLYRLIIMHFQLRISCWINIIKLRMKGHSYRHVYNRFTHTCNALLHYTSELPSYLSHLQYWNPGYWTCITACKKQSLGRLGNQDISGHPMPSLFNDDLSDLRVI